MIKDLTYKTIISFVVSLAMLMEAVDTTIINTAIPVIAHSLSVNPIDLKIALVSYLLSLAVFIPISGWVADKFGIKTVFISALIIFTFSSFWCGNAKSIYELVIARCVQGIGGSLTVPVGRLILLRTFERHEMISVMSRIVMVAALGLMLGPIIGGLIIYYMSWQWIFWVNIPFGIFAIFASLYWLKNTVSIKVPRFDIIGFILFGLSLALFTFGLSACSDTAISGRIIFFMILASIILLFIYFIHSRKITHPIINIKLFTVRTFKVSVLGNLFTRLSFAGVPFLLPLLFQIGLKYSPQMSGLLLAPSALGVLLIKPFSLLLLQRFRHKFLLIANTLLVSVSLFSFTTITENTPIYFIVLLTFIYGFLVSLQYTGMNSLAYAEIPHDTFSGATSIMSTLQQLSQSFGVAIAALLIRLYSSSNGEKFNLITTVFHHAFFAMGLITLFSTIIFLQLKEKDGSQIIRAPQI